MVERSKPRSKQRKPSMRYPNPDILLYIGVADAYALPVEYIDPTKHVKLVEDLQAWKGYQDHPKHPYPGASCYSDDTEMSCANARTLLQSPQPTELEFVTAWLAEFERGGRRKGYSRGFQVFLESVGSPERFLSTIRSDSDKNGAAMRSVPFGVLPSPTEAMRMADLQARITHDTPAGRFSAQAVALMSHFALYESAPFDELPDYCLQHLHQEGIDRDSIFQDRWSGPVKRRGNVPVAITTVHAVAHLLVVQPTLKAMMRTLVYWGGDTDSVAAIVWGIASARLRDEKLPEFLERDLEQGSYKTGAVYLKELGALLMQKYSAI